MVPLTPHQEKISPVNDTVEITLEKLSSPSTTINLYFYLLPPN